MLTSLEILEEEAARLGIAVDYRTLHPDDPVDGLYVDLDKGKHKVILLNRHRSESRKVAALAEEIGHHLASYGNIIKQNTVTARKQERAGRKWAIQKLLPHYKLESLLRQNTETVEIADELGVPEDFIWEAIQFYNTKSLQTRMDI